MNEWIEAINLVAATYSSPPLPAPVGSWYSTVLTNPSLVKSLGIYSHSVSCTDCSRPMDLLRSYLDHSDYSQLLLLVMLIQGLDLDLKINLK